MVKFFRLIIVVSAFCLTGFSQIKKDLEERDLHSKVHQINYYDVYQSSTSESPNSVKRSLSAIDVFNQKGNLRVQFGFSRNGKDCSYKKTVYSYDAKNRKQTATLFQSETGENVCPRQPPVFQKNEAENLDGKLSFVEKTIYEYEYMGKITRETVYDRENKIVQQNNYAYDRGGENILFSLTQETNRMSGSSSNFVKRMETRIFMRDKGKIRETYSFEDARPIRRGIDYIDKNKRQSGSEGYKLVPDAQNNITKEIIFARTKTFYDGDKELFSWTIYDQNGKLKTQLYILSKNDNELMRLEYNYRNQEKEVNPNKSALLNNPGSSSHYQFENISSETISQLKYILKFDECVDNPNWIPARFETRTYKFDNFGNIVQYKFQEREKPSKTIKDTAVYEKEIIYYK